MSQCVPVTAEAAPAAEHPVWGGSLWLWHQWRRRWKTPAGKLPGLSLWLLHSSRDSLPHPEWQDHTQSRNPRSPNIFIVFDSSHKQLSWCSSARNMSHGKYCREKSPLCSNCLWMFKIDRVHSRRLLHVIFSVLTENLTLGCQIKAYLLELRN